MSRYVTPASDFGQLEINSKPRKSTSKMPVLRSATARQKESSSSRAPSSSTSERRATASGSTSRISAQQQHRPPSRRTPVDQDNNDTDGNNSSERDESDEESEEDDEEGQRRVAFHNEVLRRRVLELMPMMTPQDFTPAEFLAISRSSNVNAFSLQTSLTIRLHNWLCGVIRDEIHADSFFAEFTREEMITETLNSIERRILRIFERLKLDLHDRSGADVPATAEAIKSLQSTVVVFVQNYQGRWFSEEQDTQLFSTMLRLLIRITRCDKNMYADYPRSAAGRQNHVGDLEPGNLYRRWSKVGEPDNLFWIMSILQERAQVSSATAVALSRFREELRDKNDRIWGLMEHYLQCKSQPYIQGQLILIRCTTKRNETKT